MEEVFARSRLFEQKIQQPIGEILKRVAPHHSCFNASPDKQDQEADGDQDQNKAGWNLKVNHCSIPEFGGRSFCAIAHPCQTSVAKL